MGKSMNGYVAVVLTEKSRETLIALAIHKNLFAHHMTVYFKPPKESFEDTFAAQIGRPLALRVTHMYADDRGQCVAVEPIPGLPRNREPHITVSCAPGVKPVYSNTLMQEVGPTELDLLLEGTIEFIEM